MIKLIFKKHDVFLRNSMPQVDLCTECEFERRIKIVRIEEPHSAWADDFMFHVASLIDPNEEFDMSQSYVLKYYDLDIRTIRKNKLKELW